MDCRNEGLCTKTGWHVPDNFCRDCGGGDPRRLLSTHKSKAAVGFQDSGKIEKVLTAVPQKPTLKQMVRDFAAAMKAAAADGFERVSEAEYLERRRLCSDCSGGWRCPECGCVIRLKATMRAWHCPRGIW